MLRDGLGEKRSRRRQQNRRSPDLTKAKCKRSQAMTHKQAFSKPAVYFWAPKVLIAAAGYNFSLLLRWFEWLWRALFMALWPSSSPASPKRAHRDILHGRLCLLGDRRP
jgi:hypothetical protein